MNSREKFLSVMKMTSDDYHDVEIPKVEFGYWVGTIRRWFDEGLNKISDLDKNYSNGTIIMANKNIYEKMEKSGDLNVQPVFGLDQYLTKFPINYSPMFAEEIIDVTKTYITYKDEYGVLSKNNIEKTSLPMEISHPVKDRKSWNEYKQYYTFKSIEKRLPPDWKNLAKKLKNREFPIRLGGTNGGFLGFPRQIMGITSYLTMLYDDPGLIEDICKTFLNFILEYYSIICKEVDIDCLLIWEDMAGKMGSLISPEHFRKFLSPYYKEVTRFAKNAGIDIILTDSDGYVEELLPLIIETGITGMYPFERAAGNDLLRIRKYFPDFCIIGGIDKRILFENSNKIKIDSELEIIKELLKCGRFIPHVDHFVSPDCTWGNFKYYRENLNSLIDSL